MTATAICRACQCLYFVFNLWSAKKVSKFCTIAFQTGHGCYFPKQPTTMSCYLKLCFSASFRVFLCPFCLWLCHKAHHTEDAWVFFCHFLPAHVSCEHCSNAHRPADFQNLSRGGPLLPFHIKHDSNSKIVQQGKCTIFGRYEFQSHKKLQTTCIIRWWESIP